MQEIDQLKKTNADLLVALRQVAMKATPGPWSIAMSGARITSNQSHPVATLSDPFHRQCSHGTGQDAEFISTANPAAILSLLDYIAALEASQAQSAPASAPERGLATLLQAAGAMRLVRCHDGSGEPFQAYDKGIADRVVAELRAEMHALTDARPAAANAGGLTVADYEEVLTSHRRLVRELDVLLNGEAGAAKQASLSDIVSQVRREGIRTPAADAGGHTVDHRELAGKILSFSGISSRGSLEPGADPLADRLAEKLAGWGVTFAPPRPAAVGAAGLSGLRQVARMLEGYAESYDIMGRDKAGDGTVQCNSVAVDIRQNMVAFVNRLADMATTTVAGDLPGDWQLVMDEVARATRKFPTWPTDPLHAVAVLGEEFGELTKAVLQTTYEPHKVADGELRTEAIQTAAMALRFLASLDRYEFTQGAQHAQGDRPTANGAAGQEGGAA